MLYFWSYSCLSLYFQKEAAQKQTATNGTCPMQMPPALKENYLPPRLAAPCSANQEGKSESQHARVPLLLREASGTKAAQALPFGAAGTTPATSQGRLVSSAKDRAAPARSAKPLLLLPMTTPGNYSLCNPERGSKHIALLGTGAQPYCKPPCTQHRGSRAAPWHFVNKATRRIPDRKNLPACENQEFKMHQDIADRVTASITLFSFLKASGYSPFLCIFKMSEHRHKMGTNHTHKCKAIRV